MLKIHFNIFYDLMAQSTIEIVAPKEVQFNMDDVEPGGFRYCVPGWSKTNPSGTDTALLTELRNQKSVIKDATNMPLYLECRIYKSNVRDCIILRVSV